MSACSIAHPNVEYELQYIKYTRWRRRAANCSTMGRMVLVPLEQESLARHTVFKIGGPARFLVSVSSRDGFVEALRFARAEHLSWVILGAGSNVLVSDRGFPGLVIHPEGGAIVYDGPEVRADAGVSMARLVADTLEHGLRGFEWAIGIPGSVGGSVRGNAGCFGGEMRDVVRSVGVYNVATDAIETWRGLDATFSYRTSIFKERSELVVLDATIALVPGDAAEGRGLVKGFVARRSWGQDIGVPSAGCAFKNIPWNRRGVDKDAFCKRFPDVPASGTVDGVPVGYLIDQVGLRGYRVGGAKISERHGNFIVNTGNATAEDVIMLIGIAKERVHRTYGIMLEEEIQYVGFE